MKFHFLFEQSGVFKNAALALGYEAFDYDIVKTENVDYQLDLLQEIDEYFSIETFDDSIFRRIEKDDVVFAFFPCTYFCSLSFLPLRFSWRNYKNLTDSQKLEAIYSRFVVRERYFKAFLGLLQIAVFKGFKLVIENPWTAPSYLRDNAPFKPQIVHDDRTKYGDVLKKPTAYWCLNWTPSFLDMPSCYKDSKGDILHLAQGITRSLIDYDYAFNFLSHYFGEVI